MVKLSQRVWIIIGGAGTAVLLLLLMGVLRSGDPTPPDNEKTSDQVANHEADCFSGETISDQCQCLVAAFENAEHAELFAHYRDVSAEKGPEAAYFELSALEQLQILDVIEGASGTCPPTAE